MVGVPTITGSVSFAVVSALQRMVIYKTGSYTFLTICKAEDELSWKSSLYYTLLFDFLVYRYCSFIRYISRASALLLTHLNALESLFNPKPLLRALKDGILVF